MPETTIMFCIRARLKEAAEMMGVRPCVRTGLIASVPAGDQRVPHIWPSFGQMWETRTSNSKDLAHSATQFSRRHSSPRHNRGYEQLAFFRRILSECASILRAPVEILPQLPETMIPLGPIVQTLEP